MRPSRAYSFKCETLLVSHEIPHPLDHEPTGGQGRTLGIERRQPACNLVRVDELTNAELLRQQHRSRRGFARSIGASKDDDVLQQHRNPSSWPMPSRARGSATCSRITKSAADRGSGDAQEHQHGAIEPQHSLVIEPADVSPDLASGHRGDLVHHQPRGYPQPIGFARLDGKAKQRCVGGIRRESANGDGCGRIEPIVLHDHDRARFAGVILAAGKGPYLAAFHSAPYSEMDSMKSWSSLSCALRATARD